MVPGVGAIASFSAADTEDAENVFYHILFLYNRKFRFLKSRKKQEFTKHMLDKPLFLG